MRLGNIVLCASVALSFGVIIGCGDDETGGPGGNGGNGGSDAAPEPYAANVCVGAKQAAASAFCGSVFDAWVAWEGDQSDASRDSAVDAARAALGAAWDAAESAAEAEDANCSDLALTSGDAGDEIQGRIEQIAAAINDGLDLGQSEDAQCGADLLDAAGDACEAILEAEGAHIADLLADPDGTTLDGAYDAALAAFSSAWAAAGSCSTNATEEGIQEDIESLTEELVGNTIVTPDLDPTMFTTLTPGATPYLGRTYNPTCMDGGEYRYFAKRGTVNKLVMYYQGGGACWNNLTCSGVEGLVPTTCRTAPLEDLNPDSGFGDFTNENNPFKDWHYVFVSYCTCDIHFGDDTVEYPGLEPITVQHRGFHNSKVAEKWAREHFLNPEEVFVTGSSAGAYGAWFNGPLLHDVWPASQIHVLADAGNGVITDDFLQNEFSNWNFVANLPDIPGVLESLTEGGGMPVYTESVAKYFPDTNWAHYSTLFDGGSGGQTGFFNLMLNNGNPTAALNWWEGTCQFGETALTQSVQTYDAVPSNYRYYFGTGSAHTMWGRNRVYTDTTGGVPKIVDWVNAMLASGPDGRDEAWENVVCENCGFIFDLGDLEGEPEDPRPPDPLAAPFEQQGDDVVIVCE